MKIAVTGATGFLGRYLVDTLLTAGHQVVGWTRRPSSDERVRSREGLLWVRGELGRAEDAVELVRDVDAVVHSGFSRTGKSFLDLGKEPLRDWHLNATGSLQLLDAAASAGVQRFTFISSGAVHDTVLADRPLDETHPLLPSTFYGACKASVESLVHHYGASGNMIACTLRPTSIYGLADPPRQSRWFHLVQDVFSGRSVRATGGSKTVHASDVAKAVLLLLQQDESIAGETFNCCDAMISEYKVATIAQELCGRQVEIHGPEKQAKHNIQTAKLESLGMKFGGATLLRKTIAQLVDAIKTSPKT